MRFINFQMAKISYLAVIIAFKRIKILPEHENMCSAVGLGSCGGKETEDSLHDLVTSQFPCRQ